MLLSNAITIYLMTTGVPIAIMQGQPLLLHTLKLLMWLYVLRKDLEAHKGGLELRHPCRSRLNRLDSGVGAGVEAEVVQNKWK